MSCGECDGVWDTGEENDPNGPFGTGEEDDSNGPFGTEGEGDETEEGNNVDDDDNDD